MKEKKKIYLYPYDKVTSNAENPYLKNLFNALKGNYVIVNQDIEKNNGLKGMVSSIRRTDLFILNWIEDIPHKKWGLIQSLFLLPFLCSLKILKKDFVWVLHNKSSHNNKHSHIKHFIVNYLIKNADYIITHSYEGIRFLNENDRFNNINCFLHPVKFSTEQKIHICEPKIKRKVDILIWGTIEPYKGIKEFLGFYVTSPVLQSMKILVLGRCGNLEYAEELNELIINNKNIEWKNEFIEDEKLIDYFRISNTILFTYFKKSALSSASLIQSLESNAYIIGPNTGSFNDLEDLNISTTFKSFLELENIYRNHTFLKNDLNSRFSYIENYSWDNFKVWIIPIMDNLLNKSISKFS